MVEFQDSLDEVIVEAAGVTRLSQTTIYQKFDQTSNITKSVIEELRKGDRYYVKPKDIEELIALMKLNGDSIVKKAILAYEKGEIVIINNKETSQIPSVLPYLINTTSSGTTCYIFADKVVANIKSNQEYRNLMAAIEAGYIALCLTKEPKRFTMNAQLMLTLCDCWWRMIIAPLESKIYMKGDNLTKASMYAIAFYYKMIHGDLENSAVPFNRFLRDKIEPAVQKQIVQEVNALTDLSILSLIELIKRINPMRYKDLEQKYVNYFTQICGMSILFAMENIQYLFLLVTSANYKTSLSGFSLNKIVQSSAKRAQVLLTSMNL